MLGIAKYNLAELVYSKFLSDSPHVFYHTIVFRSAANKDSVVKIGMVDLAEAFGLIFK